MRPLSLLAVAVLLTACDSGEPAAPPPIGRFEAEVGGGLSRTLSGDAVLSFFPGSSGDSTVFVAMADRGSAGRRVLSFGDVQNVLTGEGTYVLGGDRSGGPLLLLYREGAAAGPSYVSTSGTLRVTRWARDRVEGTFSADLAPALRPGADAEATVTGSFEAVALPRPQ